MTIKEKIGGLIFLIFIILFILGVFITIGSIIAIPGELRGLTEAIKALK